MPKTRYRLRAHLLCHDVRLNSSVKVDVALDHFPTEQEAIRLLWHAGEAEVTRNFCEGCPFELSVTEIEPLGPVPEDQ